MRIYLAGPMQGIPLFNYPVFEAVTQQLRAAGYTVVCPTEQESDEDRRQALDSPEGSLSDVDQTWGMALGRDVQIVADNVDAVALLPGWHHSKGACLEVYTAILCGVDVYKVDARCNMVKVEPTILMMALTERGLQNDY